METQKPLDPIKIPAIVQVISVLPYRIVTLWSNGEVRENDYAADVQRWATLDSPVYQQLAQWEYFKSARANNGVLEWPTVRFQFTFGGVDRDEAIDFDRLVTYEQSRLMEVTALDSATLGETISRARHQARITQGDLARRIGSTKQYVSKVERNVVVPKADTLQRMALALGKRVALL